MKPCLADVNLLLPLLVRHHEHHRAALTWFDGLVAKEAILCRFVHLALIRLLGNRTIMGRYVVSASAAWQLIEELMQDERMQFADEPKSIKVVLPKLLKYRGPTPKLVADAYLAAFSIAAQMRLATLDKGFGQFRELDLQLITPEPPLRHPIATL